MLHSALLLVQPPLTTVVSTVSVPLVHLVPQACHILPQQVQQLAAVRVAINRAAMPLQLLLHLTQPRLAALMAGLCPLQLLLLGLRDNKHTPGQHSA